MPEIERVKTVRILVWIPWQHERTAPSFSHKFHPPLMQPEEQPQFPHTHTPPTLLANAQNRRTASLAT